MSRSPSWFHPLKSRRLFLCPNETALRALGWLLSPAWAELSSGFRTQNPGTLVGRSLRWSPQSASPQAPVLTRIEGTMGYPSTPSHLWLHFPWSQLPEVSGSQEISEISNSHVISHTPFCVGSWSLARSCSSPPRPRIALWPASPRRSLSEAWQRSDPLSRFPRLVLRSPYVTQHGPRHRTCYTARCHGCSLS